MKAIMAIIIFVKRSKVIIDFISTIISNFKYFVKFCINLLKSNCFAQKSSYF